MEIPEHRRWMYSRVHPGRKGLRQEFVDGVDGFIAHACQQRSFLSDGLIRCPCCICKCMKYLDPDTVKIHLYKKGFKERYWYWTNHGEEEPDMEVSRVHGDVGSSINVTPHYYQTYSDIDIWTRVVGGKRKGRIYGLGPQSSSRADSQSASYASSSFAHVAAELAEMRQKMGELIDRIGTLEATMQQLMSVIQSFSHHPSMGPSGVPTHESDEEIESNNDN